MTDASDGWETVAIKEVLMNNKKDEHPCNNTCIKIEKVICITESTNCKLSKNSAHKYLHQ